MVLDMLSVDREELVHTDVAGNPNTPPLALQRLLQDTESNVVLAATRNQNLPSQL